MKADLLTNPIRLGRPRLWLYLRDGSLRCPRDHRIKHRPVIGVWAGLTCTHRHPPGGAPCCTSGYYAQGLDGVLVIETTEAELLHIQLRRFTITAALEWLDVRPPLDFRPVDGGHLNRQAS